MSNIYKHFYIDNKLTILPDWFRIEIKGESSKKVVVHSMIHVDKTVELGLEFSDEYSDEEILSYPNIVNDILNRWLRGSIKEVVTF